MSGCHAPGFGCNWPWALVLVKVRQVILLCGSSCEPLSSRLLNSRPCWRYPIHSRSHSLRLFDFKDLSISGIAGSVFHNKSWEGRRRRSSWILSLTGFQKKLEEVQQIQVLAKYIKLLKSASSCARDIQKALKSLWWEFQLCLHKLRKGTSPSWGSVFSSIKIGVPTSWALLRWLLAGSEIARSMQ